MSAADEVLEIIKQNPGGIMVSQIQKATGLSCSAVSKALTELKSKGTVEEVVKGCRKYYRPK
ncbi:MAG: helix-turn-helix domain-containing protein [Candidatus Verstraetearchaeota archaeon]|nr:helix-turn-helix domain-containing protein [Candidatus Verstraetearchaeota archaeon]